MNQNKHNSDDAFFTHLATSQSVSLRFGHYKFNSKNRSESPREKGVDVLLATDLIVDAVFDQYDIAYVISDDSDLIPAVEAAKKVKSGVKIIQVTFNPRNEWKQKVDAVVRLYANVIKKMQTSKVPVSNQTMQALTAKFSKK